MGTGRKDNSLLATSFIPRVHENNFTFQVYVKDVKSSNGTFINGERLSGEGLESEPVEFKPDDVVVSRFGGTLANHSTVSSNRSHRGQ